MATGDLETKISTVRSAKYGRDMRTALADGLAIAGSNIYRGASLGTSVTDDQYTAIKNGTFDGMYIGDYWTINNIVYRIADFDYWYNTGDTAFTQHHLVIVNDLKWVDNWHGTMNATNITTGAYVGSRMYTEQIPTIDGILETAFGSTHVLSHRDYLQNAVNNSGIPNGGTWYDVKSELMNEEMVYGCKIFQSTGTSNNYTIDNSQFKLFTLNHAMINQGRQWYWLRDPVSSTYFALVNDSGNARYGTASNDGHVRVAFALGTAA